MDYNSIHETSEIEEVDANIGSEAERDDSCQNGLVVDDALKTAVCHQVEPLVHLPSEPGLISNVNKEIIPVQVCKCTQESSVPSETKHAETDLSEQSLQSCRSISKDNFKAKDDLVSSEISALDTYNHNIKKTGDVYNPTEVEKDYNPQTECHIIENQNSKTLNANTSNVNGSIENSGAIEACATSAIDTEIHVYFQENNSQEIRQNLDISDCEVVPRVYESQNVLPIVNTELENESKLTIPTGNTNKESFGVTNSYVKELHVVFSCNDQHVKQSFKSSCFPKSANIQVSVSGRNEASLIADIRELRSELENLTDSIFGDTYGLQQLFSEHNKKTEKSKSAKKRKKQKQKLAKLAPARVTHNAKFAQSTEDLDFGVDVEVDSSLTCPVCLELYYLPRSCHPCGHIFCDPCLRRLTLHGWEEIPCPLCRTVIQHCELQQEFDNIMRSTHADLYNTRSAYERRSRFRHSKLPFTPPIPLGRRLIRHLRTQRARQSDSSWMSHDWFKFLLGCTVGVCTSMLIMLLNRVKSINDVRDVNIVFLSLILGASLTMVVFKMFKI